MHKNTETIATESTATGGDTEFMDFGSENEVENSEAEAVLVKDSVYNEIYNALETEMQCTVCKDILIEPISLPCNHIFCNYCIDLLTQRGSVNCPICNEVYNGAIPERGIEHLLSKLHSILPQEIQVKRSTAISARGKAKVARSLDEGGDRSIVTRMAVFQSNQSGISSTALGMFTLEQSELGDAYAQVEQRQFGGQEVNREDGIDRNLRILQADATERQPGALQPNRARLETELEILRNIGEETQPR